MYILLVTLLIAAVIAMWIAVIYSAYKGWGPWLRSRLMEVQSALATVVDKRDRREYVLSADFGPRMGTPRESDPPREDVKLEPIQWFVSFETEDGRHIEYPVRQRDFEAVMVGDRGRLFWRGEMFVRFEPTSRGVTLTEDEDKE